MKKKEPTFIRQKFKVVHITVCCLCGKKIFAPGEEFYSIAFRKKSEKLYEQRPYCKDCFNEPTIKTAKDYVSQLEEEEASNKQNENGHSSNRNDGLSKSPVRDSEVSNDVRSD